MVRRREGAKAGDSTNGAPSGSRRRRPPTTDVTEDDEKLRRQLEERGLYAASTMGDGNCLFRCVGNSWQSSPCRALSDQLYGDAKYHSELRQITCDQLEADPDRYAAFVETEKPFPEYISNMRTLGIYGGHLELAAFAQRYQKPIHIFQPDLVYVVGCDDDSRHARASRSRREEHRQAILDQHSTQDAPSARTARRTRRADRLHDKQNRDAMPEKESVGPLYLAYVIRMLISSYHNWEHYSSVRSLGGPHQGLPQLPTPETIHDPPQEHHQEDLVLRSVPWCSRERARQMLCESDSWEDVVEELIAEQNMDEEQQDTAYEKDLTENSQESSNIPTKLSCSPSRSRHHTTRQNTRRTSKSSPSTTAHPSTRREVAI
ncbi:ubiquitinyl hydrolase 1 [Malassezia yamatoensis]|uniref:Ubiquitinyl hydrolase 1 n=1 Tax=Malassezia yamatoensis TaxID=253288 RepID=A0AAJ6CH76_9BASI|nr:ubiquitinyl hydrolase 1 [Malassezia yamatoensis]